MVQAEEMARRGERAGRDLGRGRRKDQEERRKSQGDANI